jgi:hypothetical protein
MFIVGNSEYPRSRPEMTSTLWHCQRCDSFVSIHSAKVIHETFCPMCFDTELEFCGTFESLLESLVGRRFTDA